MRATRAGIPGAKLHPKSQSYDSKLQTWCARWQVKTNLLRGGGGSKHVGLIRHGALQAPSRRSPS